MNTKNKRELYRKIISLVNDNQLAPAFHKLRELAAIMPTGFDSTRLDPDEEIYTRMVHFFILNAPDPEREQLKDNLRRKLFWYADVLFSLSLSTSPKDYLHVYRKRHDKGASLHYEEIQEMDRLMKILTPETLNEEESRMERLFFDVWMTPSFTSDQLKILKTYLTGRDSDPGLSALLVSALVLHTLEKFSVPAWMLLADIYAAGRHQLWQRALIGMMLAIIRFDHRMYLYPEVGQRLIILTENPGFTDHLEKLSIQLVRTGDTEKVSKRIQEEILPEMMKLAPKIQEKLSLDQFLQDESGEEKNPDWEKFFEEAPGIYQKMEELNRLQSEGVDLFISTFSQLKHFDFFQHTHNWFLPFSHLHPSLTIALAEHGTDPSIAAFYEIFGRMPVMCNSDKYSFSLNLAGMPAEQQKMLTSALSGELEEMNRLTEDEALIQATQGTEVFHQYTQDLYRFFRVHPSSSETEDPFAMRKQLYQCVTMEPFLEQYPILTRRIAEYYFEQEHYTHAIHLFERLIRAPQDSPELFQKLGYAYQMSGDLDKAIENYKKAELFDCNALWNLRKIAWCHHLNNNPDEALKSYKDAELLAPDSVQIKLNIGNLLLQTGDLENALQLYLKAEELNPGDVKTLRPVAWCLFLQGEPEKAAWYYDQIMEKGFNHNDLLNYGHVKFVLGDRKAALDLYRQSYNHRKSSPAMFTEAYNSDRIHLEKSGISPQDAAFMLDAVVVES